MRTFLSAVFLFAVAGCSSDPPPPAHGFQLKTPDFPLGSGEEKYLCYVVSLDEPVDVAVTAFESFASNRVHHMEVFRTLSPEMPGLNACDGSIKVSWLPLFGGGVGTGGLELPAGAGFQVPKASQLLLQIHLLNATEMASTEKVVINMTYAADASTVTPAGIFAFGSMNIDLPIGATNIDIGSSCALPKALNVFAVQPHMHTLGTKLTFETGTSAADAAVVYKRDPWSFGAQPIDNWQMPLTVGQFARATCTFTNTTDHEVVYGESTANEMCYFILFYTPYTGLDACLN